MKILYVSDTFPPEDFGGAERICYNEAIDMAKEGHDVSVLTLYVSPERKTDITTPEIGDCGVKIYRPLPFPRDSLTRKLWRTLGYVWGIANHELIRDMFRNNHFDIVHTHYIQDIGFNILIHAKNTGHKVVHTFHGYQFECPKGGLLHKKGDICVNKRLVCKVLNRMLAKRLSRTDRIIAISRFIERRLIMRPYLKDKVVYLPNGVKALPPENVKLPADAEKYFLFVGRLTIVKGIIDLIKIFNGPLYGVPLVIIGDGPEINNCRRMAEANKNIRILGQVPNEELRDYYANAIATVVPSKWHEVMNTVIWESLISGTPVIASDLGGNSEMIENGKNGFLFQPGNLSELRVCVENLLEMRENDSHNQLATDCKKSVAKFSNDTHIQLLSSVYSEILRDKNT